MRGKKMKKVLFVATVSGHIKMFHQPYLKLFRNKGWKVCVATKWVNDDKRILQNVCDVFYDLPITRSPYGLKNISAIKSLKKIIESEHFDIVHCHTPMGGVVARLAARKARKNGTRVIYTAHGFHFFTGAPLKNWLLFYPIEKYLAKYTDTLITINREDYNRAKKKFSKRCNDIQYIPGVGIDPKKFDLKMSAKEKHELRTSLGLKDDDFVMIFPARLDKNKNQGFLIRCMVKLTNRNKKIHLLLPGQDELNGKYQALTEKLRVEANVHFLGFRDDIQDLLSISDVAVSSSRREGLPVNLLEALYMNLPIVAYRCRGAEEIINNMKLGYIIHDEESFVEKVSLIANESKRNKQQVIDRKMFDIENTLSEYEKIVKVA